LKAKELQRRIKDKHKVEVPYKRVHAGKELVKKIKGLNLDDLLDNFRQLIMDKWDIRRDISNKMEGAILPHIIKDLREKSRNLDMNV